MHSQGNTLFASPLLKQPPLKQPLLKQPPEVFCEKSCSYKLRRFHGKTHLLESPFNKITGLHVCSFNNGRLDTASSDSVYQLQYAYLKKKTTMEPRFNEL